ncbi:malto-oligosyltrehalose synthase [Tianweitania sp. BSSL-BM11]|uniref:Malto-oligosyltrehalose synthase n=1 Tax=Tianweitania aestuarii TaxID=2814886 RepID=A0ABS5RSI2_9HYPH|nr:malto-oligosyltrehalose synthase [Tianweitania aestuarii]MBS9719282.1 malto-oligosyltrehalose synthase [Tianweitania aestuarii]
MMLPTSTYRLQFREGFTFDKAVAILPYLKTLGISHVYASPIFSAATGSTHGYDVTDHNEIDPAIGGREGFDRLSAALKQHGLGLILDIVPNHMAASLDNPWWRSVIELGPDSPYARHFDIDWRERLTLPILGKPYDEAVADGEIALKFENGKPVLAYFDNHLPLHPDTIEGITPETVGDLSGDRAFLEALHARQPYQLTFWKTARKHLSYRRFFEVTGLVGVRVEDPAIFDDVHRLILELVRSGQVDGLRVDHVDGLADPKTYLDQLRAAIGPDTYLVVEKILNGEEVLPQDWPIEGTTGYEFTAAIADLLSDGSKTAELDQAYADLLGAPVDLEEERRRAKQVMVKENFETELKGLVALAKKSIHPPLDDEAIRDAIAAIVIAFPVYRTYINKEGIRDDDRRLLEQVANDAKTSSQIAESAINAVLDCLFRAATSSNGAAEFTTRFQQLTGPVTAKSVEDTLFYRFNKLIALNEVGCDPAEPVGSVARFHDKMKARVSEQPHGLLGTSTHDTKRGEDARARLYAISEAPDVWAKAVARWRSMNADAVQQLDDGPAPETDTEWLLYQALAGIWTGEADPKTLASLKERFLPYVEKALREAKRRTDWSDTNEAYESAVLAYAERLFAEENQAFHSDFDATLKPIMAAGRINALSQTLIKLTAPGIPDIYQGAEGEDLSLVDPDNRRAIDFTKLSQALASNDQRPWPNAVADGTAKQRLIAAGLALRNARPDLFASGNYQPLEITGEKRDHAAAYLRSQGDDVVLAVVPRLPLGLYNQDGSQTPDWGDTAIVIPADLTDRRLINHLTSAETTIGETMRLADLLKDCPVALLATA